MESREFALLIFTILAQMSVGSFLVLGIVHFYAVKKAGMEEADRLSDRALVAIIVTLGLGLFASLFHLGNPLNAYRAISNPGTSWLSREILFGVGFALIGAIFVVMQRFKIATFAVRNVIAWLAAVVGLGLVYSMASLYMLPTQPAWNTLATPVLFYTTTLLLGSLAMGAAFVANYAFIQQKSPGCADIQCTMMREALSKIAIASVVLLGIELVTIALRIGFLSTGSSEAVASAAMTIDTYGAVFVVQLVLLFVGAGVFGVFVYQNAQSPGKEKVLGNLAYGAFALVLISEVLGRFLFYATQVQIGI